MPTEIQAAEIEIGRARYELDVDDMSAYVDAAFTTILDTYIDGLSAQARATKRMKAAS